MTDKDGILKIDHEIGYANKNVQVLILLDEEFEEIENETDWLRSLAHNAAFDFLNDPEEDIYSLKDGKPLDD